MKVKLRYVIQRFPNLRKQVEQMYAVNEDFRSLCEDYQLCVSTLHRWRTGRDKNQELMEEYWTLRKELEKEVLRFLKRIKQPT